MQKHSKQSKVSIRRFVCVSILIVGISAFSSVRVNATTVSYSLHSYSSLTPHDPISITSDSGFEVFPGAGSEEDPYVIEGYSITTTALTGIYITGTTKYFVIRNCYVDAEYYGIFITNVADGTATVINNTCNNSYRGIYLSSSGSSTIANNTCNNNGYRGIYLSSSGSSTVTNNTFTNSGLYIYESTVDAYISYTVENNWVNGKRLGFYTNLDSTTIAEPIYGQLILINCTDVTVRDQIINNAGTGLFLGFCTDSVIVNNTCSNNDYGIRFSSSGSSTVANNTCNNNVWGIYLFSSGTSIVANNTFTNCGLYIIEDTIDAYLSYTLENNWVNGKKLGFYTNLDSTIISEPVYGQLILVNCTNVTVRDQTLNNAGTGLFLYSCIYSTINNNTCSNNYHGFYLVSSVSSTVANNTCNSNGYLGIYLSSSGSSTVANNTCNSNGEGIFLVSSVSSTVANNTCNSNGYLGIYLSSSGSSTVANNTCSNNDYGFSLVSSDYSTVANNTCNNNWYGIYLLDSSSSTVANNTCNNNWYGILLYESDSCVVTYNLLQDNEVYGVYLRYDSDNNLIHHNTFVHNYLGGTSQAFDDCVNNYWYDTETLGGNYWSDWSGTGSYPIDGSAGAVDLYPLGEPVVIEYPQIVLLTLLLSIFTLFLTRIISKKVKK